MKNITANKKNNSEYNVNDACGNCWGHQKYTEEYTEKIVDVSRGKKDNFLSRFVKKYINK